MMKAENWFQYCMILKWRKHNLLVFLCQHSITKIVNTLILNYEDFKKNASKKSGILPTVSIVVDIMSHFLYLYTKRFKVQKTVSVQTVQRAF